MTARIAMVAAMAALATHPALGATPPPRVVDAELLEFLGSLDEEDSGWQEYLEQKPVKTPAKPPAKAPPPKRSTEPTQVKEK